MEGVFVTGVDTGVGKTTICSGILKMLHGGRKVVYWKPIQAGTIVSDDTTDIKGLTGLPDDCFMEPAYRFVEPLSPYMAAKKRGKPIEMEVLAKTYEAKRKEGSFVIIEGAGGLLVPFADNALQIDLIDRLKIPVLLVAEDRVGAINQTLLSLNAARDRGIEILGVVLTRARHTFGNAECIAQFGNIEVLAELDPTDDQRTLLAQVGGNTRLRKLFSESRLPH